MTNAPALLRSLITYVLIVPLALLLGYLLTQAANTNFRQVSDLWVFGMLLFILIFPLLVRFHYPWMLFSWSALVILFFVTGAPNLGQAMIALSLTLSILERIMNPKKHFIKMPSVTVPLMFFVIIVVITAKMNGGIGMHAFGSDVYGGRKYIDLFIGVAGYFALTSLPIPPEKAKLYASLYLLGGATTIIGDLYPIAPSWAYIFFHIFPPSAGELTSNTNFGGTRFGGLGAGASVLYLFMLARYGLRGIFFSGKLWRPVFLLVFACLALMGGFRGTFFIMGLSFMFMFFAEGLHRTRLLGIFILLGILGASFIIPFSDRLPVTYQRAMSIIPGLHVTPEAQALADASTNWRIQMWTALLPQIPEHLLVGKGYAISQEDYNEVEGGGMGFRSFDAADNGLAVAGDYHNGMLSLVLCFGIWGVIVFVWFIFAGLRVMYFNLRYGRPELFTFNALFFILYLNEAASYLLCFGGLTIATDVMFFVGPLGMSIALNHGMCRPPPKSNPLVETEAQKRLIPALPVYQH